MVSGVSYLVMDYVRGESLATLIHREGALPLARALNIFVQAAAAIMYAHSKNVMHRDLKPGNIMLESSDEGERVKIVDFGIAKLMDGQEGLCHVRSSHRKTGI